jgi:hypothetical protein
VSERRPNAGRRSQAGEKPLGSVASGPDGRIRAGVRSHGVRSAKGAKISAAKKGVRQLELATGELTLTEAWLEFRGEFKIGRGSLRDGVESGKLRHRRVERPGNQPDAIVFDRDQLREDLAKWPCTYPGCDKGPDGGPAPALGDSERCTGHAARGDPAVELVCQHCGETFMRPVSWLRGREGRGHYCSNECKGKAFDEANPGRLEALNPDGAHEHHQRIAETVAAEGLLDRASWTAAHPYRYSPSQITARAMAGELPSVVRPYDGSVRRVIDPDALAADEPPWAHELDRRANFAKARHGVASLRRIYGRCAPQRTAEYGGTVGRPKGAPAKPRKSKLTDGQKADIDRLAAEGRLSQEAMANAVGATRGQVRRHLARS